MSVLSAIEVLNRIHSADPSVLPVLVSYRVRCNQALADDPTVQVGPATRGHEYQFTHPMMGCNLCGMGPDDERAHVVRQEGYEVGFPGILNGIYGVDANGQGFIAADYDDLGVLTGFVFNERAVP